MSEAAELQEAYVRGAEEMRAAFLKRVTPRAQDLDDRRGDDPTGYLSGQWVGIRWACDRIKEIDLPALANATPQPGQNGESGA